MNNLLQPNSKQRLNITTVREILKKFQREEIPFAVIGSFARRLHGDRSIIPADCDLIIYPCREIITKVIDKLQSAGFIVNSWSDQLTDTVNFEQLTGRYYLRALRGNDEVIDLTYECEPLNFKRSISEAMIIDGLPVVKVPVLNFLDHLKELEQKALVS